MPQSNNPIEAVFASAVYPVAITGVDLGQNGIMLTACDAVSGGNVFATGQVFGPSAGVGETRDQSKEPGKLEFPNLVLTLPESAAQSFKDYFDNFVIKGNAGQGQEKTGSLVFLNRNRKKELLRLDFPGLGIFRITSAASNSSNITGKEVHVAVHVGKISSAPSGPANLPPR